MNRPLLPRLQLCCRTIAFQSGLVEMTPPMQKASNAPECITKAHMHMHYYCPHSILSFPSKRPLLQHFPPVASRSILNYERSEYASGATITYRFMHDNHAFSIRDDNNKILLQRSSYVLQKRSKNPSRTLPRPNHCQNRRLYQPATHY